MAEASNTNSAPPDPYVAFRFSIEIEQVISGGFSECAGLNVETEVDEYREGGLNEYTHKLPKGSKYTNLTLKRGFIDSEVLWSWHQDVIAGKTQQRKNISILLLDSLGNEKHRWNVTQALPVKWSVSDLKADGNTVLLETLEIVHHGFTKAT
jgi:phage tail-like protein